MSTIKGSRYAAAGTALVAAAIQLSTGTATAANTPITILVGGGPDDLACQASGLSCFVSVFAQDRTTLITLSVNGKTLVTGMPVTANGEFRTSWTPNAAGHYTLTAQQGAQTQSTTVDIIDNNGLEALSRRITNGLTNMVTSMSGSRNVG